MKELYSICWNITNRCNENCKFCYRKICKDNQLEENKKIFDNLSQIKIDKITFSGGEPLLYEHLFELVDYIKSKSPNINLSITTNGKRIDDEMLEKIISRFNSITFSIDSSSDEVNEVIGRGKGHLSKVISLLEKCTSRIKIKINTVANKLNIKDLENIYDIISKYDINRWKILIFWPLRRGDENKDLFYLKDEEAKSIEDFVHKKQKNNNRFKIHYNDFSEFTTSYFVIYPDGSVENMSLETVGNLLQDDISEILQRKEKELINHDLRKNN